MNKRPAAVAPGLLEDKELQQELAACGVSHAGLSRALTTLADRGYLDDRVVNAKSRNIARRLGESRKLHGAEDTPYGKVVQEMDMPIPTLKKNGNSYTHSRCFFT